MSVLLCSILIAAILSYIACLCTYRLWLSPVAGFPGPRLAAATYWVEFWYDVVCDGRFGWKVREWHEVYGEIDFLSIGHETSATLGAVLYQRRQTIRYALPCPDITKDQW